MRTILFFYIAVLLCGCRSYPKYYQAVDGEMLQSSDSCCSVLFAEIKEKWAVHKTVQKEEEGGCYYYNQKLTEKIIENKDCFIGISNEDIYGLFGNPSRISGHNSFYYMSKECNNSVFSTGEHHLRFTALDDTIGAVDYYPIVTDY